MAFVPALSRRLLASLAVAGLVIGGVAVIGTGGMGPAFADTGPGAPSPADGGAVDRADFDPGLIISDYNFFNAHAMTEPEIQTFLESQDCISRDGSPCLSDYRQDTPDEPADEPGACTRYRGADDEPASRIIAKVSLACGVSPRVLLVTLQKEQSLLTRPSSSGYRHATGYGCPDTAACDSDYFGFFNQVYQAAWQFRHYTQHPDRRYHIGSVEVRFHPRPDCGASVVDIANQATANLYNYTPYQPDTAAVHSGGDACSSHGNLNFWVMYNSWFGSSTWVPFPALGDSCLNLSGGAPCREALPLPAS